MNNGKTLLVLVLTILCSAGAAMAGPNLPACTIFLRMAHPAQAKDRTVEGVTVSIGVCSPSPGAGDFQWLPHLTTKLQPKGDHYWGTRAFAQGGFWPLGGSVPGVLTAPTYHFTDGTSLTLKPSVVRVVREERARSKSKYLSLCDKEHEILEAETDSRRTFSVVVLYAPPAAHGPKFSASAAADNEGFSTRRKGTWSTVSADALRRYGQSHTPPMGYQARVRGYSEDMGSGDLGVIVDAWGGTPRVWLDRRVIYEYTWEGVYKGEHPRPSPR